MCEFIFIKGNPLVMESAKLPFAKCLEGSDNPHPLSFCANLLILASMFRLNEIPCPSKAKKKKKLLTVDIVSVTLKGRQECRPRKQQRG